MGDCVVRDTGLESYRQNEVLAGALYYCPVCEAEAGRRRGRYRDLDDQLDDLGEQLGGLLKRVVASELLLRDLRRFRVGMLSLVLMGVGYGEYLSGRIVTDSFSNLVLPAWFLGVIYHFALMFYEDICCGGSF